MTNVSEIQLDDSVLDRIAGIICGDDGLLYRRGFEIVKFFRASGWSVPDGMDGESRRYWTVARLQEGRGDGAAMARLVLRLADRREYLDEEEAYGKVQRELNTLLEIEGYAIEHQRGRPLLVESGQGSSRMTAPIEQTASISQIVRDQEFGVQLQRRLEEAHRCWQAGAPTAAIIMLGSVLEGVLYDVALSRRSTAKTPTDHLETLINMAGENRWIAKEVVDYAHVLRDHRNLVHPKKQWTQSYAPEDDTVDIAWRVVVAALNDLADLPPPHR